MIYYRLLAIALVCAFIDATSVKAAEWDTTDKVLFGGFIALQTLDALQTNEIRKHQDKFRETNPLFGNPPNMAAVIGVKAAFTGLTYYVVKDMPSVDRKVVLGVLDIVSLSVVGHNYQVGIRVGW